MKTKYRQFHGNDLEDKFIYENFDLPNNGVFVDVGAGPDGIQGSNTYFFEKNGWTGICIDADPRTGEALQKNRKKAYTAAISDSTKEVEFYMSKQSSDISGLEKPNSDFDMVRVKTTRLEDFLKDIDEIDILSIDTEGTEIDAFNSFDYKKHNPKILIIENMTQGRYKPEIQSYFVGLGYNFIGQVGANAIFSRWTIKLPERNPHLMVYGSSYDRGLEHLLKLWPKIKAEVEDAELHVFYGWNLFDKVYHDNPASQAWKAKMNEMMTQPGITHLGRISHEAVKKEMQIAGIWAYPTHFGEISCITAMKAQAYGAIPVVIEYAALEETVQYGIKVKGDIYDPDVKDAYVKALISLLKDTKQQDHIRPKMMEWAKKFSWENVAKQWSDEFKSEPSLDRQVEELLENNQALKAWELVKDTNWPKKDRLWLRVQHAFDPDRYRKYYSEELTEHPIDEQMAFNVQYAFPRFKWLLPKIEELKPKTILDVGCADGYLALTTAQRGIESKGINLYEPSVKLANERAKKHNVPATFEVKDLFEENGKYDAIVLFEVLEHLPDPQKAIDHLMSQLNDGGRLFVSTPCVDHIGVEQHKKEDHGTWDDGLPSGHLQLFTEQEFKDFFKKYTIVDYFVDAEKCQMVEVKK